MKAYLANGLFSDSDFQYNNFLAMQLRTNFPDLELYLPQENAEINDKSSHATSIDITRADDEKLLDANFLVAVIDGVEIDSGVACEIGKFAGFDINYMLRTGVKPRPIFALYTDIRQQGTNNIEKIKALVNGSFENPFVYRNLYVLGTIKDSGGTISTSVSDLIDSIGKYIKDGDDN